LKERLLQQYGAENSSIKSNIISAVEAVTGLPSHKIQVFSMSKLP